MSRKTRRPKRPGRARIFRIAARTADAFHANIPESEPEIAVCLRAIERAVGYFDATALQILDPDDDSSTLTDAERMGRVEAILGGLGQMLGAATAIADTVPDDLLELLELSELRAVNPTERPS